MNAAGLVPYESVLIADIDNASRLETYVIPAEAGSGEVSVLGAAAQLVKTGDRIIILAFAFCSPDEAASLKPKIITLDQNNRIVKKSPP